MNLSTTARRQDQELLRARTDVLDVQPADGPVRSSSSRRSSARRTPRSPKRTCACCTRATTTAIPPRSSPPATKSSRRNSLPGNTATSWGTSATALGLVAAAEKAKLQLFLGSYPITPASDILHELSGMKKFGVKTFQAEDEIAAICSAIGASYAGALAATTTSGPGLALKTEGDRPRGHAGTPAGDHQRPARRPEHRPPDQNRTGGPAAGHVSAATAKPRSASSPPPPRPIASPWPTRRPGSPSST